MPLDRRKHYFPFQKINILETTFLYCAFMICCWPCHVKGKSDQSIPSSCPVQCTCSFKDKLVNCSNRSLRKIPQPIPDWVVTLSFRNNKITGNELKNEKFHSFPNLKEIDFSDNRLNKVNLSLQGVPSLRTLHFDRCTLDSFPVIKGDVSTNITHLSLSHNSITQLGDSLKSWPSLHRLDLSFNRIRFIPDMTFHRQNYLSEINLHKNRVSSIGRRAFTGANSLQHLYLGRNRIKDLKNLTHSDILDQSCVGDLRNLLYLDLSRNHIGRVEGLTFQGMCRLKTLLLNDNSIATLRDGAFYSLKALLKLNMDNNLITSVFKEWLYDLESLQILSLAHNNISSIRPNSWKFCTALQQLNLSHNDLGLLPSRIFQLLSSLESLDIGHNSILVVEDEAFVDLSSLHTLDLSYNRISSMVEDISGAFTGLLQLKNLSLRSNKIRSLSSDVLKGAEGVTYIDLRQNDVTSIQNRTFDGFLKLKKLDLDSASLLCDCQLAWFSQWLRTHHGNMTSQIDARCFHPPRLKGRNAAAVRPDEFECGEHPVPTLLQQPGILTSYKGENVTLECSASATLTIVQAPAKHSSVNMSVVWRRGPARDIINPMKSSSARIRNQQRQEGGHMFFTSLLLLYNVGYNDEEDYSCVISNDFGHAMSTPARLRVVALPRITVKPENKTVKYDTEVEIGCQATGHPLPEISWEKADGSRFAAADEHRLVLSDAARRSLDRDQDRSAELHGGGRVTSSRLRGGGLESTDDFPLFRRSKKIRETTKNIPLHISKVKPVDGGRYKCTAKSSVGVEAVFVTITVLYPPIIEKMPGETNAVRGGNAVLKCMVNAHPAPQIKWYVNDILLKGTARHFFAANGQLLVIVEVGPRDEGKYTCSATNYLGTGRGETSLALGEHEDPGSESNGIWGALKEAPGIVVAVLVCVLVTSLVWLTILCCTRKKDEGAYSTNTDISDLPQMDSSSHDSLDKSHHLHSTYNLTTSSRPTDFHSGSGRYFCAPDLVPSSCHTNVHPHQFRSVPRSGRVDQLISRDPGRLPLRDGFTHALPRPPMRAASTSHVHSMHVELRPTRSLCSGSARCLPDVSCNKPQQIPARSVTSHPKRRRRGRRPGKEDVKENDSVMAGSSSSESENAGERQRLFNQRQPTRTITPMKGGTLPTNMERTTNSLKSSTNERFPSPLALPTDDETSNNKTKVDVLPPRDRDPPA